MRRAKKEIARALTVANERGIETNGWTKRTPKKSRRRSRSRLRSPQPTHRLDARAPLLRIPNRHCRSRRLPRLKLKKAEAAAPAERLLPPRRLLRSKPLLPPSLRFVGPRKERKVAIKTRKAAKVGPRGAADRGGASRKEREVERAKKAVARRVESRLRARAKWKAGAHERTATRRRASTRPGRRRPARAWSFRTRLTRRSPCGSTWPAGTASTRRSSVPLARCMPTMRATTRTSATQSSCASPGRCRAPSAGAWSRLLRGGQVNGSERGQGSARRRQHHRRP